MKRYGSIRWILLATGLIAILGLTGMNVYSLYALQENTLESARENKKLQIAEFTDRIRYRFYKRFNGLGSADLNKLERKFRRTGHFTDEVTQILDRAARDSMYKNIYFIPANSGICQGDEPIYEYRHSEHQFRKTSDYSEVVCDGMGIARTQMKSLIGNYQYNNKIIFDTHRSITLALVNPADQHIFGYLTMPFNQQYMRNDYLPNILKEKFGSSENSGMNVWLRDWTNNEIIASSNPDASYNQEKIQFAQNFPDFFDYWKVEVAFTDQSVIAASNASLFKNLVVLGAAVVLLLGALVFMFISAQKERELAERQAGFLANVTHELKTPLAVMQAAGENLADGRVTDQSRLKNYGTHIYKEAVRLRKMIEKLLDVAKADAGQSLIEPQPADLAEIVHSYIEEHEKYIKEQGFTIHLSVDEVPMIKADIDSLDTILGNLVENAIKYSSDDKYLGIRLRSDDEEVQLSVEDHGVGMKKKSISHIFDKFFRVEDTLTAHTKGHGLGLSIVKNLVELNGGNIEVESEPGEGSTFTVTFPVYDEVEEASQKNKNKTESKTSTSLPNLDPRLT